MTANARSNLFSHKDILNVLLNAARASSRRGATAHLAQALRREEATVASWYQRGAIPHWEWDSIARYAARIGFPRITTSLLSATARRRGRRADGGEE